MLGGTHAMSVSNDTGNGTENEGSGIREAVTPRYTEAELLKELPEILEKRKLAGEISKLHQERIKLAYETGKPSRFATTFIPFVSVMSTITIGLLTLMVSYQVYLAQGKFQTGQQTLQ